MYVYAFLPFLLRWIHHFLHPKLKQATLHKKVYKQNCLADFFLFAFLPRKLFLRIFKLLSRIFLLTFPFNILNLCLCVDCSMVKALLQKNNSCPCTIFTVWICSTCAKYSMKQVFVEAVPHHSILCSKHPRSSTGGLGSQSSESTQSTIGTRGSP